MQALFPAPALDADPKLNPKSRRHALRPERIGWQGFTCLIKVNIHGFLNVTCEINMDGWHELNDGIVLI